MTTPFNEALLDEYKFILINALETDEFSQVNQLVNDTLAIGDVAHLLESIPANLRSELWPHISDEIQGEVLSNLNEDIQQSFLRQMSVEEIAETTQDIESDDLADILQQIPAEVSSQVLELLPSQDRLEVEELLAYPEDSAGGLMNTDYVAIRADVTIDAIFRYLRLIELPEHLDVLWVIDRERHYVGSLAVTKLLRAAPETLVSDIMSTTVEGILASEKEAHVARQFERHDWFTAPVINDDGILIGRITIDDVVDVILDTADHNMMSMAGLDEEDDVYASVKKSSQDRAIWLGINMATAFIAAAVMSRFEASLAAIVALAVLSPVVASMGGIAGSQTLTLMIRGMATGHISRTNLGWMLSRELGVGLLNGSLWAAVIGGITLLWYGQLSLALIISSAILVNICLAVLSGTLLPFLLKSAKIDPALSGSVILTTLTDVFGFLTFLGLATLFLL